MSRDEHYVLALCDKALRLKSKRQHRFRFLLGDTGRGLPVDAYCGKHQLVVEFKERQHFEAVRFFDKRVVAGGITRGQQRRRYDLRRRRILPRNGVALVELLCTQFKCDSRKRLKRDPKADMEVVRRALRRYLPRPNKSLERSRDA